MTTFSFSVCVAPEGDSWNREFSNAESTPEVVDLEVHGVGGWASHRVFNEWLQAEGIESHRPDWCLTVAQCTRGQLGRFVAALHLARQLPEAAPVEEALAGSDSSHFVVVIAEF